MTSKKQQLYSAAIAKTPTQIESILRQNFSVETLERALKIAAKYKRWDNVRYFADILDDKTGGSEEIKEDDEYDRNYADANAGADVDANNILSQMIAADGRDLTTVEMVEKYFPEKKIE